MLAGLLGAAALAVAALASAQPDAVSDFAKRYGVEVDRRLSVPAIEAQDYARRLDDELAEVAHRDPQFAVLVDRSRHVQAVFVFWGSPVDGWALIGASPASTGFPGSYDHFETPLGAFEHSLTRITAPRARATATASAAMAGGGCECTTSGG